MANVGAYRLKPRLFLADRDGVLGDEITPYVIGGEVTVDVEADVPSTFTCELLDVSVVPPWSWLVPHFDMQWYDPDLGDVAIGAFRVGLFVVPPVGERHSAAMGRGTVEGKDPVWLLTQDATTAPLTFQQGANVVQAIRTHIERAGFSRHRIPTKGNTFRKKRSYDAGTTRLEVINDLLMRIGYYPVWADRQGVISSAAIRSLGQVEPFRKISSALGDVVDVVELATDVEKLCNRVVVVQSDPAQDAAPIVSVKSNTRADSPSSIPSLGFTKVRTIEASNIDGQAEADALARQALEEGASALVRLEVATIPDPAWEFREPVHVVISRDDGTLIVHGRWWWTNLTLGFAPSDQPMRWTLNRLEKFEG